MLLYAERKCAMAEGKYVKFLEPRLLNQLEFNDIKNIAGKTKAGKEKARYLFGKKVASQPLGRQLAQALKEFRHQNAYNFMRLDHQNVRQMLNKYVEVMEHTKISTRKVVNMLAELEKEINSGQGEKVDTSVTDAFLTLSKPTRDRNLLMQKDAAMVLVKKAKSLEARQQGLEFLLAKVGKNKKLHSDLRFACFQELLDVRPQSKEVRDKLVEYAKANKNTKNKQFKDSLTNWRKNYALEAARTGGANSFVVDEIASLVKYATDPKVKSDERLEVFSNLFYITPRSEAIKNALTSIAIGNKGDDNPGIQSLINKVVPSKSPDNLRNAFIQSLVNAVGELSKIAQTSSVSQKKEEVKNLLGLMKGLFQYPDKESSVGLPRDDIFNAINQGLERIKDKDKIDQSDLNQVVDSIKNAIGGASRPVREAAQKAGLLPTVDMNKFQQQGEFRTRIKKQRKEKIAAAQEKLNGADLQIIKGRVENGSRLLFNQNLKEAISCMDDLWHDVMNSELSDLQVQDICIKEYMDLFESNELRDNLEHLVVDFLITKKDHFMDDVIQLINESSLPESIKVNVRIKIIDTIRSSIEDVYAWADDDSRGGKTIAFK